MYYSRLGKIMNKHQLNLPIPSVQDLDNTWFSFPQNIDVEFQAIPVSGPLDVTHDVVLGFYRLQAQKKLGVILSKHPNFTDLLLNECKIIISKTSRNLKTSVIKDLVQYVFVPGTGWTRSNNAGAFIAYSSMIKLSKAICAAAKDCGVPSSVYNRIIFREDFLYKVLNSIDHSDPIYIECKPSLDRVKSVIATYYERYRALLCKLTIRTIGDGSNIDDIINDTHHIIQNAAYRYAPEMGVPFLNYASNWIKASVYDYLENKSKREKHVITTNEDYLLEGEEDFSFISDINRSEMNNVLYSFLESSLTNKEIEILSLSYGLFDQDKTTLESIGKIYGYSGEWIRKLLKGILIKLNKKAINTDLKYFLGNDH
jgi:RNA polymerase sigma factor (sigma-70 family)